MIDKTRLGIPFFDDYFGGIYRKRPALCVGRHGSGKTLAALQAVMQSVREGERGLMLSSWHAHDLTIIADTLGLPLSHAVESRQVVLLEYADIMPTQEFEKNLTLPPGSFMELQEIVEANGISRVVIDTVLPWVAIHQEDKLPKHIYSFIHALERMGVTALFTLPKPVSALAFTLKNRLEEQVPIVFTLEQDPRGNRSLVINKYLGEVNLPAPLPFSIVTGTGFAPASATPTAPEPPAAPARRRTPAPPQVPVESPAPPSPPAPPANHRPIRFAAANRPEKPPAQDPEGPIKFSAAFRR